MTRERDGTRRDTRLSLSELSRLSVLVSRVSRLFSFRSSSLTSFTIRRVKHGIRKGYGRTRFHGLQCEPKGKARKGAQTEGHERRGTGGVVGGARSDGEVKSDGPLPYAHHTSHLISFTVTGVFLIIIPYSFHLTTLVPESKKL